MQLNISRTSFIVFDLDDTIVQEIDYLKSAYRHIFFNDTATTEIYTLSLHDALPISAPATPGASAPGPSSATASRPRARAARPARRTRRSEEHTSELQSPDHLVCRLLLEKKKKKDKATTHNPPYTI